MEEAYDEGNPGNTSRSMGLNPLRLAEEPEQPWISLSKFAGPPIAPNGQTFAISATLDSVLRNSWSGIRLIVLALPEPDLSRKIVLKECTYSIEHVAIKNPRDLPSRRHRDGLLHRARLNKQARPSNAFPVICSLCPWPDAKNVVFEVGEQPGGHLVVYDRTFPSVHSIFVTLECTRSVNFTYLGQPHSPPSMYSTRSFCKCGARGNIPILVHHLTLSSNTSKPPCPVLPPNIIFAIAEMSIDRLSRTWRSDLLKLSLVAKWWHPALNVFYKAHSLVPNNDRVKLESILRSIEGRPERARLVQKFSIWNYADIVTEDNVQKITNMMIRFLRSANHIELVDIYPMDQPLYGEYLAALSGLRNVKVCKVTTDFIMKYKYDGRYVSIGDLQRLMLNWPELTFLDYEGNLSDESNETAPTDEAPAEEVNTIILDALRLKDVILKPSELPRFSSSVNSCLRYLALNKVTSSNSDFRQLLKRAAQSLTDLTIVNCTFSREAWEERALDELMPELLNVKHIHVVGDSASWRVIARKQQKSLGVKDAISLMGPLDISPEEIIGALEITSWSSIWIASHTAIDADVMGGVQSVASRRKVSFEWRDNLQMSPDYF